MSLRARPDAPQFESLTQYFEEIGKIELLTAEEEAQLAGRIREGDDDALKKLVKANLRFVVSVAKQYRNQGLSLPDLVCEGNMGLIEAAKRFDETKGFKFISYARWWIRQAILKALAEQSRILRLPMNKAARLCQIGAASRELEQELGRTPSPKEIADRLDMSADEAMGNLEVSSRYLSLDAPIREGESYRLFDVLEDKLQLPPDDSVMNASLHLQIKKALSSLTEREAEVIRLYFGIDQEEPSTLAEIGERYGISRERVRQIKEKAIQRLRHRSRSQALRSHYGFPQSTSQLSSQSQIVEM